MFRKAQNSLIKHDNIRFHQLALFSKKTSLRFDSTKSASSKICDYGDDIIAADCLDNVVTHKTTYIKLDIEGYELEALKGMKKHIITYQPKLAIAVYHDASHFFEVPKFVLGLRRDYDVYLRHYTEGWCETIMYFVPQG